MPNDVDRADARSRHPRTSRRAPACVRCVFAQTVREAAVKLWIKICGLTTEPGVAAAVESGVDAVGFVFAPSSRRVTAERAQALAAAVPASIARVAVMLHPMQQAVDEMLRAFRPDVLQTDASDFDALVLPASLGRLPVLRPQTRDPDPLPARVLMEGARSGTGEIADWTRARALARRTELVLAGGLDAANVATAIAAVRPFGVDVSSGVEDAPGRKSPQRIVDFVAAARQAAASQSEGEAK
jgi:phosphoribosylanthranilate isomerase